jgi:hypothetical protein
MRREQTNARQCPLDNGERSGTKKVDFGKLGRGYRLKLSKLCRPRYGNHFLPDDEGGRALLTAMLHFGLSDESAMMDVAPWLMEVELARLKRKSRRLKWAELGQLLGLTFEEWKACRLWITGPVGATAEELEGWLKDKKEKGRQRAKRYREKKKREREQEIERLVRLSKNPRVEALLMLMPEDRGYLASELVAKTERCEAFQKRRASHTMFAGGPPASMMVRDRRYAVHATLNQMERRGLSRSVMMPGRWGDVKMVFLVTAETAEKASKSSHGGMGIGIQAKPKVIQGDKGKMGTVTLY